MMNRAELKIYLREYLITWAKLILPSVSPLAVLGALDPPLLVMGLAAFGLGMISHCICDIAAGIAVDMHRLNAGHADRQCRVAGRDKAPDHWTWRADPLQDLPRTRHPQETDEAYQLYLEEFYQTRAARKATSSTSKE